MDYSLGLGESSVATSAESSSSPDDTNSTASTEQNAPAPTPAPDPFDPATGAERDANDPNPGIAKPDTTEPKTEDEPSTDETLTEKPELTEDEVKELSEDPMTPRAVREKLKAGLAYAEKFKAEKAEIESKYAELTEKASAFEGKEALAQPEIERLRAAEEKLFNVQSFSATPDDIDKFIAETNPAVHKEYQSQAAWNALFSEDGSPREENFQAIIDRQMGYDPNSDQKRVDVQTLFQAAEALRDGRISKDDLHEFATDAEYNAYVRQTQFEEAARARDEQLKAQMTFQEEQIRQTEVGNLRNSIIGEVFPHVRSQLQRFKLQASDDDPKLIAEHKQEIARNIHYLFNQTEAEDRNFQELNKALENVSKARGVKAQEAQNEVKGLLEYPQYKQRLASAASNFHSAVEKLIAKEAYKLKIMALGLEVENSRPDKARAVVGNAKQTAANLPKYSAEELARMSANDRNETVRQRFTQSIRNGQANRLGG